MSVMLLTENRLEFVSLKGGCTDSSESTLVKMPHCWKSYVMAQFMIYIGFEPMYVRYDGTLISQRKGQIQTSTTNLDFHAYSAPFHAQVH